MASSQPQQPVDFEGLQKALEQAQNDEERLEQYVSHAFTQFRNQPDSLFVISQRIDQLDSVFKNRQEAYQNFVLAFAWRQSNSDSSRYYARLSSEQLKNLESHIHFLRAQNLLGTEYARYGYTLEAEAAFVEALEYRTQHEVTDFPQHFFYGNLGNIYSRVEAYDLAIEMYQRVLENSEAPTDRCNILSTMAANLSKLGNFDRAVTTLQPCLDEVELPPHIASIVRSNMSQIYQEFGEEESALEFLEQAASISLENRIPNLEQAHQVRLGNLYLNLNHFEKANEIQELLASDRYESGPPNIMIDKHLFLARISNLQVNYDEALNQTDRAIAIAQQMNMKNLLDDVYSIRSEAYLGMNDLTNALEASKNQIDLVTEVSRLQENRELANAKVRHQLISYETELASSQTVLNTLTNRLGIIGSLFLLLSLGSGFLYYRYSGTKADQELAIQKLSESEERLKELEEAIKKQKEVFERKDTQIFVHINSKLMLAVEDIRYIQSDGNYVRIFLSDESKPPILERCTLKHCESILPEDYFRKIHRSTIVNLLHIVQVEGDQLTLKDGTQLSISRSLKKDFFT